MNVSSKEQYTFSFRIQSQIQIKKLEQRVLKGKNLSTNEHIDKHVASIFLLLCGSMKLS